MNCPACGLQPIPSFIEDVSFECIYCGYREGTGRVEEGEDGKE